MTFSAALRDVERDVSGSDLRLAYEAVGRSTRTLADELNVSQRTVQRWLKYEARAGGEGRNPARSASASDIRAMAQTERQARALDALASKDAFDTDSVDVDYESADDGARHARSMPGSPLNMQPVVDLYRNGAPMPDVERALADALGASYGLPEDVHIVQVHGLTLQ